MSKNSSTTILLIFLILNYFFFISQISLIYKESTILLEDFGSLIGYNKNISDLSSYNTFVIIVYLNVISSITHNISSNGLILFVTIIVLMFTIYIHHKTSINEVVTCLIYTNVIIGLIMIIHFYMYSILVNNPDPNIPYILY